MGDRTGQRLDNYHLLRRLGSGSFGEVYLAEHIYRKTHVAVKVLPQLSDAELPSFLNEARTIRLRHPHIVQVLDFGVDNRVPFIVMEYVPNGTLRQRYPKGTQLPLNMLVSYIKQVADALQYAHDEKLIHRDVKPENILLRSDDDVLLSDFGIATMARSSRSQSVLEMAGTIAYMAPEQLQGKPVIASDQYALGIIAYEWLCGERPFHGGPIEIATQHMLVPPPLLLQKVPNLSPDIEQVVLTVLQKEPSKRFASIQAFANALEQAAKPKQPAPIVSNPISPVPVTPTSSLPREQSVPIVSNPASRIPAVTPLPALPKEQPVNVTLPPVQSVRNSMPNMTSLASEKSRVPPPAAATSGAIHQPQPMTLSPHPQSRPTQNSSTMNRATPPVSSKIKRSRLFYPTLALIALLIMATGITGAYFYLYQDNSTHITQSLQRAQADINTAKGEVALNPSKALQDYANAQTLLRNVQQNSALTSDQERLVSQFLSELNAGVRTAVITYNTSSAITSLPCGNPPPSSHAISTGTPVRTIALVQQNGKNLLYALGLDSKLYQMTDKSLIVQDPALNKVPIMAIAGSDTHLFVLTAQPGGTSTTSYALNILSAGQTKFDPTSVPIDPKYVKNAQMPTLLTAFGPDVYVLFTSSAGQISDFLLDYTPTDQNHQYGVAAQASFSASQPIVSLAAFPSHQVFLLQAGGLMQSIQISNGNQVATSVLVTDPINPPLSDNAQNFTVQTPVPTVPASGSTSLAIPGTNSSSALAVGTPALGTQPHLYIMDATLQRVLDLKVAESGTTGSATPPVATATSSSNKGGGGIISGPSSRLQLVKQYASSSLFAQMKSITVDSPDAQVNVLTQNSASTMSLTSFSVSQQNGC